MFILKRGEFFSDEYHIREKLKTVYGLKQAENEDYFSFRKRSFFIVWSGFSLADAISFLFGPYSLEENWEGMEKQKPIALDLMNQVKRYDGNFEKIKTIINEITLDPSIPEELLAK